MAQLKDTLVQGNLTVTNGVQLDKLYAPAANNSTVFSPGADSDVLVSNGESVYWTPLNNIGVGNAKIFQGTCPTAASTVIKAVTCPDFTAADLVQGALIFVTFDNTNSGAVANLKLNVNGTGDFPLVKQYNYAAPVALLNAAQLQAGITFLFTFKGTASSGQWVLLTADYNTNTTYTITSVWSNTAASVAAKVSSNALYYALRSGNIFEVTMRYSNSAQGPLTFSVNGTTAPKPIYINGVTSSSTNYTLPAGKYIVYYDGTNYQFRTDGLAPINISGTSNNVTGTVALAHGGTGATNAATARSNLGLGTAATAASTAFAAASHTHGWANLTANANLLTEGTSNLTDNSEILTSYASNNGFADTNAKGVVYRRDAICMYNYVKSKLDSVYLPLAGGVITGPLTIAPPSGHATLILRSVADEPNDFILGVNNTNKWSLSCRQAGGDVGAWFGLYSYDYGWVQTWYHNGNSGISGYLTLGSHVYLGNGGHLHTKYNNTNWDIVQNHGNSNVALNACGGNLAIAYKNTTAVNFFQNKITINNLGTITTAGNVSASGTIDATGVISTNAYFNGLLSDHNVEWTSQALQGMRPISSLFNNALRANRFAGIPAAAITMQYSTNGGSSWTNYPTTTINDVVRRNLFSDLPVNIRIVPTGTTMNANSRLRITINTGTGGIYSILRRLQFYISTSYSANCTVTIKCALESAPNNYSLTVCENTPLTGWSGWNDIPCNFTTYGNTPGSQYGRIQMTFASGALSGGSATENGFTIISIRAYGGYGWTEPNYQSKYDRAYLIDPDGGASFGNVVNATAVYAAVWNDYAEYRNSHITEPGRVVMEKGDDTLILTTERLSHFAGIVSDTWGFAEGETADAKTPLAVSGRVLAYTYRDRYEYQPGDCVCAAPGGTVDIMTREEVMMYPDRIVGTVSCVPEYEEWGGLKEDDDRRNYSGLMANQRGPVKVNGRIWIKVR